MEKIITKNGLRLVIDNTKMEKLQENTIKIPAVHFKVDDKVFETEQEAKAYAFDYMQATNIMLEIKVTSRRITYRYIG